MKKYFFILSVTLLNICLIACNNGSNQNGNQNSDNVKNTAAPPNPCEGISNIDFCENVGGIGNFIIRSSKALIMMGRFDGLYKTDNTGSDIKAMDNRYWVDKCTILAIDNFLRTQLTPTGNPKYDGIRIYMGCEVADNPVYMGEQYQRKTTLFIFATTLRPAPPAGKSEHEDDRVNLITGTHGCSPSPYIKADAIAAPQIGSFDGYYRVPRATKDALSTSIWIDACVIRTLADVLNLPNANLDGANINMAAYDVKDPVYRPSQKYDKQSTMIIVPTSPDGHGGHSDNWTIVDCLLTYYMDNKKDFAPGGFNHGELCPQICN